MNTSIWFRPISSRTTACTLFMTAMLSGCANLSEKLSNSMEDSYVASSICDAIDEVVPVRVEDIRNAFKDMVSRFFGNVECGNDQNNNPAAQCLPSLKKRAEDIDLKIHAILDDRELRQAYGQRIGRIDESIKTLAGSINGLRDDAKKATDLYLSTSGGTPCRTHGRCIAEFQALLAFSNDLAGMRIDEINTQVRVLQSTLKLLAEEIPASSKKQAEVIDALNLLQIFRLEVDQRAALAQVLLDAGRDKLKAAIDGYAQKLVQYQVGRLTVALLDRGMASFDKVLDRIDEKTWFVAQLTAFSKEQDIKDGFEKFFYSEYMKAGRADKNSRGLSVAFVYAACEKLAAEEATSGQQSAGRTSFLMYPMFIAAVTAMYGQLDAGKKEDIRKKLKNPDELRKLLLSWIENGKKDPNDPTSLTMMAKGDAQAIQESKVRLHDYVRGLQSLALEKVPAARKQVRLVQLAQVQPTPGPISDNKEKTKPSKSDPITALSRRMDALESTVQTAKPPSNTIAVEVPTTSRSTLNEAALQAINQLRLP